VTEFPISYCENLAGDCPRRSELADRMKTLDLYVRLHQDRASLTFIKRLSLMMDLDATVSESEWANTENELAFCEAKLELNCNRPCIVEAAMTAHIDQSRLKNIPNLITT
jgi:hypothetical protein